MSNRGVLMDRYAAMAAEEDRRLARLRADDRMASGASVGDIVADAASAILGSKNGTKLEDMSGGFRMNFDAAVMHLSRRATFHGLDAKAIIEKARAIVWDGVNLCDSPIEKRLLPWLVCEDYGPNVQTFPVPICDTRAEALPPKGDLFIVPQLAFVKFRMDFAMIRRLSGGHLGIVAVECDGSGFHSAVRDTLRNGWLASFQIKTVRAMGATIHERPREVSARVAEAVMELGE
jgi:hypothetical protein